MKYGLILERPEWLEVIVGSDAFEVAEIYGSSDERYSPVRHYVLAHRGGTQVIVITQSLGAPQCAHAVEVLAEFGVEQVARLGTCGSYEPDLAIGACVLPTTALAEEGCSRSYVPPGFQGVPDHDLLASARRVLEQAGEQPRLGPIHTKDHLKSSGLLGPIHPIERVKQLGCVAVDMETSLFFNVCQLRRLRCVSLQVVSDVVGRADEHQPETYVARVYERIAGFAEALVLAMSGARPC
jgi:uridine phosphorylase